MSTDTSSDEEVPEDLDERAEGVRDGNYVTFEEHNANRE